MKIKFILQILMGLILLVGVVSIPWVSWAAPDPDCHARLNDDPTDYIVLQDAIDASNDPDDVVKASGTCSYVNVIDKSITIEGGYSTSNWMTPDPVANPTTIDAAGITSGVHIGSSGDVITATLRGLRIINGGAAANGGGVYSNNAVTTIENCQILTNTATSSGGGIYLNQSPNSQVINSTISNNRAPSAGGINVAPGSGNSILDNNLFTDNDASIGSGGGIQLSTVENVSITNNEFDTNTASQYGAGIMFWSVMTSTVTTNTFNNNIAISVGGGLAFRSSDGNMIVGNTFTYNRATGPYAHVAGGAIRMQESDFNTVQNNTFTGNSTPTNLSHGFGGAIDIYLAEGNIIQDNDFAENYASHGNAISYDESQNGLFIGNDLYLNSGGSFGNGAIYSTDTDNITFTQNTVEYSDDVVGAFYLTRGDNLTLRENKIHHNGGRGIYIGFGANLTVEDNEIYENDGGVHIQNMDVSIQRNNISNNADANDDGAGMVLQNITSGMVANNIIADNETLSGDGPGIYLDNSSVSLHHNTIAHNLGGGGQGIFNYLTSDPSNLLTTVPTVDIINSIIIYQDVGIEVSGGTTTTIGDTLWGTGQTATIQKVVNNGGTVNQIGIYWDVDPGFIDPQDGVLHLKSDSAAIDKGTTSTTVNDDFDGETRPNGSQNDLGADEYYAYEIINIPPGSSDTTMDGALTIEIPDSVTSTVMITYTPQTPPLQELGNFEFAGLAFQLEAANANGNPITEPEPPFTLTLHYAENRLPTGTNEIELELRRYDDETGQWVILTVLSRDIVDNSITLLLEHLSEFALFTGNVVGYKIYLPLMVRSH